MNNTTITPAWVLYPQWLVLWCVLTFLLCAIGLILNILLVSAIIVSPALRHGSGVLIAHSILLEVFLCAIAFPLVTASTYTPQFYVWSKPFCQYTMLLFYGVLWAENWADATIAINRFIAIFFPHGYKKTRTPTALAITILIGWIVPLCTVLVLFFEIGAVFQACIKSVTFFPANCDRATFLNCPIAYGPWQACGARPTSSTYAVITIINTSVPIAIIGVIYITIFSTMFLRSLCSGRKTAPQITVNRSQGTAGALRKRLKSARMLSISYIWYSICYLPAPIVASAAPVAYGSQPLISLFLRLLLVCSGTTSPMIYLAMNDGYRRSTKSVVMWILSGCRDFSSSRPETGGTVSGTNYRTKKATSVQGAFSQPTHPQN
ncbi:orexin receptor type 2-like [Paramacrobiotus metropolitanus]|uniref:orexin receptor type 2-like n=1 Tax=Paramacrobiotus metropolitanus TaxID=2943436 RepID=UPI00244571F6|nr:orexin receptor type 2-like [Paramacrobiotus metropolitanus]